MRETDDVGADRRKALMERFESYAIGELPVRTVNKCSLSYARVHMENECEVSNASCEDAAGLTLINNHVSQTRITIVSVRSSRAEQLDVSCARAVLGVRHASNVNHLPRRFVFD